MTLCSCNLAFFFPLLQIAHIEEELFEIGFTPFFRRSGEDFSGSLF